MKAYLVNPTNKSFTEIEYTGGYQQISKLIGEGCSLFTTVQVNKNGDCLFVDDEGLLTIPEHGRHFFTLKGYDNPALAAHPKCKGRQPLIGNALLLGTDAEGDSTIPSPKAVAWLKRALEWHDEPFLPADVDAMGPLMTVTF